MIIIAKLIVGKNEEERKQVALKISQETLGKQISLPHPDFLILEDNQSLTISAVRNLEKSLARKPYALPIKIAIIHQAEKLTLPAQNAILKTLEEPPAKTLIILTAPRVDQLIPTLISRCQLIRLGEEVIAGSENGIDYLKVLTSLSTMRVGERLQLAMQFTKDKTQATDLVLNLLILSRKILLEKPLLKTSENLHLLQKTLRMLAGNINPQLALGNLFLGLQ